MSATTVQRYRRVRRHLVREIEKVARNGDIYTRARGAKTASHLQALTDLLAFYSRPPAEITREGEPTILWARPGSWHLPAEHRDEEVVTLSVAICDLGRSSDVSDIFGSAGAPDPLRQVMI